MWVRIPPPRPRRRTSFDGIPVCPDLDGILEPDEMRFLADLVERRGGNVNRILSSRPGEIDVHQLNCTYYSALGEDDDRYVAARDPAVRAGCAPIYYVGLLAGRNDADAVESTGEGRAINRHDYAREEIEAALAAVTQRVLELVRLRCCSHPASDGTLSVEALSASGLRMAWANGGASCVLEVDLRTAEVSVTPVEERGLVAKGH